MERRTCKEPLSAAREKSSAPLRQSGKDLPTPQPCWSCSSGPPGGRGGGGLVVADHNQTTDIVRAMHSSKVP